MYLRAWTITNSTRLKLTTSEHHRAGHCGYRTSSEAAAPIRPPQSKDDRGDGDTARLDHGRYGPGLRPLNSPADMSRALLGDKKY